MAGTRLAVNSISQRNRDRSDRHSTIPLTRNLSVLETWGFGFTGHLAWLSAAPAMHNALGASAILVWLPGTIVGMLLNFQVQRLGRKWPDIAGGTPNYAARLLKDYPILSRYAALAYFFSWVAFPTINALILTDLIKANLEPLGISCPETALNVGFTAIAFIVGFTGTRALSILHLCFVLPAVGFLLVFCTQGIGWLLLSPASPGFFPSSLPSLSFVDWAKWFFFAVYATYACETASSFVGDSRRPGETLRFLGFAAWLNPIVYLGGSWVLMRLATAPGLGDHTFSNLLAAAQPFWGNWASFLVTLLIASSCLLGCATTVSNCPRILYQLARDGHLSPVFAVVSGREVFGPGLAFTFLLSLVCLAWGDLESLVMVSATAFVTAMMSVHLGVWLNRGKPEARWPWQSLGFFLIEAIALVVGGLAWDRQNLAIGLLFPVGILVIDRAIRRIRFAPFHPGWWIDRYQNQIQSKRKIEDFVALQVGVLIFLLCSTAAISWGIKAKLDGLPNYAGDNLLVVLLITVAFVGVAIACWTSLPQVAAIAEARQQAERLFITALDTAVDGVLVLDESGAIEQANPAAVEILSRKRFDLIGHRLNELLPELVGEPAQWPRRSEHAIGQGEERTIETTLSQRTYADFREYIVILRDITERKQAEIMLQSSAERLEITVRERTEQLKETIDRLQREIGVRYQTEKALHREREFLNALLDNLQEGIVACDANGVLTLFNKATREFHGLPEQRLPAEQWAQHFDLYMSDGKTVMEVQDIPLFRAFQGQTVHDAEMIIAPKQGKARFLLANGQAIIDGSGKKLGAVVAMHDITERKKAQEALARANEELELRVQQRTAELQLSHRRINRILESITDAFFALDQQWQFTYLNEQAELLLQKTWEELIGKNIWDEFPEAVGSTFDHQYHQAVTQQVCVTFEEFYPPLDTWFEVRAYPSEDGLSVYFGNITERKTSEAALQESEARFRQLAAQEELLNRLATQIRNSLELETILEAAVNEMFSQLSSDLCTFSWYRPDLDPPSWEVVEEVKKEHLPSWVGQLHPDASYRPYTEKIVRRQIVRVDDARTLEDDPALQQLLLAIDCASVLGLPIHTPSGRIGMVSCTRFHEAQPWTESELMLIEAIANQLAIAITQAELYAEAQNSAKVATEQALQLEQTLQELQQTQSQLIQTEKMSSLGQLVAGVAHEINNPVNFIYGNITYLNEYTQNILALINLYQQRYPNPDPEIEALIEESELDFLMEDLPKILSSIKVGAQRIREIVSTLRNFSRLDEAEMKPVNIHDGIDSTLLILQSRLKEKPNLPGIQIIKEYGKLPEVECYAGQLNQVFMNILNNAIDALHSRDKGRSLQQIKERPSLITIRTQVLHNNRVGISIEDNGPGMPSNIISRIFDPFFTTKPVGEGTGLGLSISYQIIVDKHGGRLECRSQPDCGTEFWIEIPLQPIRKMNSHHLPNHF